jgi:hypothetical protein
MPVSNPRDIGSKIIKSLWQRIRDISREQGCVDITFPHKTGWKTIHEIALRETIGR